jgi:hypothetical protein
MSAKKKAKDTVKAMADFPVAWIAIIAAAAGFTVGVYRHEISAFFKEKAPVVKDGAVQTAETVKETVEETVPKIKKNISELRENIDERTSKSAK